MAGLAVVFPGTLYYFRKEIGLVNDTFTKYVVYPKCHTVCDLEKCHQTVSTALVSNRCTFITFPSHRQRWRWQVCGAALLKEVTLKCGTKKLYPHKIYCYQSIIKSLENLFVMYLMAESGEICRQFEKLYESHLLRPKCTCIHTYLIAFLIMDLFVGFGYLALNGIMVFSVTVTQTINPLSFSLCANFVGAKTCVI